MLVEAALSAVDGALKVQGYRPLAMDLLNEAGEVDISSGRLPDDLTAVLLQLTRDPSWHLIGEQLALIRTRGGPAFERLYLRVKKSHLCLTIVYCYRDERLSTAQWRSDFDWCWDVLRSLEDYVGRYRMSPDWAAAVHRAVDRYGDAGGKTLGAALSLLASAIELSEVSRGPNGSFLGVALSGLDVDLVRRLKIAEFSRGNGAFSETSCVAGYAWEPGSGSIYGSGRRLTLERKSLERSLRRGLPPLQAATNTRGVVSERPARRSLPWHIRGS